MTVEWTAVARRLEAFADTPVLGAGLVLIESQRDAISALAARVRGGQKSLLLADEVGMGKTVIAAALVKAVQAEGGRSAIVIPPGLGAQWRAELRRFDPDDRTIAPLRSYWTFLDAFKRPEDLEDRESMRKRRERELANRRQQRELPSGYWWDEPTLLLSHRLGAIRKDTGAQAWHLGLVDAIGKVDAGVRRYRRDPRQSLHHNVAREAVERIMGRLPPTERVDLSKLAKDTTTSIDDKVRTLVARGLGPIDLVVIDEAHKARGKLSSLSHVLSRMIWTPSGAFRLGLTATPVELDAQQWLDTLRRLGLQDALLDAIRDAVREYVSAVDDLRTKVALSPSSVGRFRKAAVSFQACLSTWVLRRDLRDDPFISRFQAQHGNHRCVAPIEVPLRGMSPQWKRAFLASEAMSLLAEHSLTPAQRRLRLSLPDGRNVAPLDEEPPHAATEPASEVERVWASLAQEAIGEGGDSIFSHPAIVQATAEIEELVGRGQKVLVFGRFTRPMRALTFLLDAREMVRRLCAYDDASTRWPGSTLPDQSPERRAALVAALADPAVNVAGLDEAALRGRLEERALRHDGDRRDDLAEMRFAIALAAERGHDNATLLTDVWRNSGAEGGLVAALEDHRPQGTRLSPWSAELMLEAFGGLLTEVRGRTEEDEDDSGAALAGQPLIELVRLHLADFIGREGHFARLMDGSTAPQTRRLLQAAFGRDRSWPQVLVAQSTVAREGLNLQGACRVVVMLHLEWNPGVLEQQIGRVDRIGSRWRNEAGEYLKAVQGEPPRILIRPVLVRGTYTDHQWSILERRWTYLRAQLNGDVVLPGSVEAQGQDMLQLLDDVRQALPNLKPLPRKLCAAGVPEAKPALLCWTTIPPLEDV